MNREELIAEISKSAKVTKKEASEVLSATIDAIQSAVKKATKLLQLVSVHLKLKKELQESAETHKQAKN